MSRLGLFVLIVFIFCLSKSACEYCEKYNKINEVGVVHSKIKSNSSCRFDFSSALNEALSTLVISDARIILTLNVSKDTNVSSPVVFLIKSQRNNYKLLKLPYTYDDSNPRARSLSKWYYEVGGNLCFDENKRDDTGSVNTRLEIDLDAPSTGDVEFSILIRVASGLTLSMNNSNPMAQVTTDILSPTFSTFYRFSFDNTSTRNVTVFVEAEVNDREITPCTMLSIQDATCPIFDDEHTIKYTGKHQAILRTGVKFRWELSPKYDPFNGGFSIVLVVLHNDAECSSMPGSSGVGPFASQLKLKSVETHNRKVKFRVTVYQSQWDSSAKGNLLYWILPHLVIFAVGLLVFFIPFGARCKSIGFVWSNAKQLLRSCIPCCCCNGQEVEVVVEDKLYLLDFPPPKKKEEHGGFFEDTIVAHILYFLGLLGFITFRVAVISRTTDMTNCYYNKLCSYQWELFGLTFFTANEIASSSAYILLGFLFGVYFLIRALERKQLAEQLVQNVAMFNEVSNAPIEENRDNEHVDFHARSLNSETVPLIGKPQKRRRRTTITNPDVAVAINSDRMPADKTAVALHPVDIYPLDYTSDHSIDAALCILLVLEGFLSAMYHVCANASSFLMDAPILDLMMILGWIRVFRIRYPIYLTPGWTTLFASINIMFEIIFTLLHYSHAEESVAYVLLKWSRLVYFLILVLSHCLYIYCLGHVRVKVDDDKTRMVTKFREMLKLFSICRVNCCGRLCDTAVFTIIFNLVAVLYLGFCKHAFDTDMLLTLTEMNIIFAVLVHLIRKVKHDFSERYPAERSGGLILLSSIYFLLWIASFVGQLWLDEHKFFDWSSSHAYSRNLSKPCVDGVYDLHDYYHFAKALNLFFMLMTFTTLNDSCAKIPKNKIRVF